MIGFVPLFILLLNRKSLAPNISSSNMCIKTMCYIVYITRSLHWRYIKTALQEYVINRIKTSTIKHFKLVHELCSSLDSGTLCSSPLEIHYLIHYVHGFYKCFYLRQLQMLPGAYSNTCLFYNVPKTVLVPFHRFRLSTITLNSYSSHGVI